MLTFARNFNSAKNTPVNLAPGRYRLIGRKRLHLILSRPTGKGWPLYTLIIQRDPAAYRSEEIAAHAEAEARATAKQLVALQQRLATLKDSVAAAQRVAAARETAAAAAIQRNAADTAAELRKQDVDKQISQSEREARVSGG